MSYTQIGQKTGRIKPFKQKAATTVYSDVTEDLSDLPQMMKPNQALNIANYIVTTDGGLAKRGGLHLLFNSGGTSGITLLSKYDDNNFIYAYSTAVAAYDLTTGTSTVIKGDFSTSDPYSGQVYGGYFFICNGGNPLGRISRVLAYKDETVAFTVGAVITGQTSGATATILEDANSGTTGQLTLFSVTGTFVNGEVIKDNSGTIGSATVNGVIEWEYTEVLNSPRAKVVKVIGPRLYLGNLSTDSTAVAYSATDTGVNPPFTDFTVSDNAAGAGLVNYRRAGPVAAIEALGNNVVVFADNGKWAFVTSTVEEASLLKKVDNFVMQRVDMGGCRATIVTPDGLIYANEGGIWIIQSLGQSNVPFSQQEYEPSVLLGVKYFDNIDLTSADLAYNAKNGTIFLTCAKDSEKNNFVIAYNVPSKTFSHFTGWNINRIMNNNGAFYGAGSAFNKVWELFAGSDDDGNDIWTDYLQELQTGALETRKMLMGIYADAFMSLSTVLKLSVDIYDVTGAYIPNKLVMQFKPQLATGRAPGYGTSSYGGSGYGDAESLAGTVECFDGARFYIRNYQRIRIHITANDQLPHTLIWIKALTKEKVDIRRRKITQINT